MYTNIRSRGFTLIELLVVIAIIGILASVVLASLNSARAKGADAAIRSSINNGRAQAEIFYDDNSSSYNPSGVGVCGHSVITNIQTTVNNAGGAFDCDATAAAYRMSSSLRTGGYYCVDSTGKAVTNPTGTNPTSGTACP